MPWQGPASHGVCALPNRRRGVTLCPTCPPLPLIRPHYPLTIMNLLLLALVTVVAAIPTVPMAPASITAGDIHACLVNLQDYYAARSRARRYGDIVRCSYPAL